MFNFLVSGFLLQVAKKFDLKLCFFVILITLFSTISMSSLVKSEEIRNQSTVDNVIKNNTGIELSNEDIDQITAKAIEVTNSIYSSYITASVSKNVIETIYESEHNGGQFAESFNNNYLHLTSGVTVLPPNIEEKSMILIKKNFASNIPGPSRTYDCNHYINLLIDKKISGTGIV